MRIRFVFVDCCICYCSSHRWQNPEFISGWMTEKFLHPEPQTLKPSQTQCRELRLISPRVRVETLKHKPRRNLFLRLWRALYEAEEAVQLHCTRLFSFSRGRFKYLGGKSGLRSIPFKRAAGSNFWPLDVLSTTLQQRVHLRPTRLAR